MRNYVSAFLLIALAVVLVPSAARAQEQQPEVVPISTISESHANGLQLSTFFVVRDKTTGRVIPPNQIESAKFQLSGDDEPVPAILESPTTPIKIALLLDESGSMAPFIPGVRAAAKDAIAKAPDQTQFAIFRFSEVSSQGQIAPDLGFTPKTDSATINTFIDTQYDSRSRAPTCLYNIALQATRYLAQNTKPEERRAIILFTDGKDERLDGRPCSDRSLDDVTREAAPDSSTPMPIYTVGLCADPSCGQIDRTVLDRMSSQTKAISRVDTQDKLAGLFYDIMDDLKSQRLVQATIAPCQEKQATLLVQLVDARDPIRGIVQFNNDQCYTPRATVDIGEPQPNAKQNTYTFPATIKNLSPLELHNIAIQIIDPNATTVYTETLQDAQFQIPAQETRNVMILVPARLMVTPGDYTIRVSGLTPEGVPFLNKTTLRGRTAQVLGEILFKHTLSGDVQITISSVRPNSLSSITVTVQIANKDIIDPANLRFLQYKATFFKDTNEVDSFGPTGLDLTNAESSFVVEVPLSPKVNNITADTGYKVALTLLTPADARRGTPPKDYVSNQQPFTLTLPPQKSFWERVTPVIFSPIVLGGLLVVVLGGSAAYIYARYRSRRVIPRPFNSATVIRPLVSDTGAKARANPLPEAIVARSAPNPVDVAGTTVIHDATEMAVSEKKPYVSIRVLQTVDPSQVREETLELPCVIGRKNAHMIITGDQKISRAHLEINIKGGEFIIKDCDSINGTTVANTQLKKGGSTSFTGRTIVRLGPNTIIEVEPRE